MPARVMSPGTYRLLEWGTSSSQPGSSVRDVNNDPVFTGSRVVSEKGRGRGRVEGLLDEETIEVLWSDADRVEEVSSCQVRVVEAFPAR